MVDECMRYISAVPAGAAPGTLYSNETNDLRVPLAWRATRFRGKNAVELSCKTPREGAMAKKQKLADPLGEPVAGNGLLDRRFFLQAGAGLAGVAATANVAYAETIGSASPPSMLKPGAAFTAYGMPSHWRENVKRVVVANPPPGREVTGSSRTPLQMLEGMITPAGLHYVRNHNGTPDIDPDKHQLAIFGMVKEPLIFDVNALMRYPMTSEIRFMECAGNSGASNAPMPPQATAADIHGLLSCSEWTGVKLSTLLGEAGIDPKATWLLAEGADSLGLHRSVPIKKALDDAMIVLYQNGERIQPGQGYPMRLWLPGYEGNMNVKYLRRITLTEGPAMGYYESRTYSQVLPNGKAYQFYFLQEVKSFISSPSPGLTLKEPGIYEISGVAYSGTGRITKVMVSADGGKSWAQAALQEPVLPKAFTRFRIPWRWAGGPAVLQSRAWDETGAVQPTRSEIVAHRGQTSRPPSVLAFPSQHYNGPTSWAVDAKGEIKHVYA
jgi:sulfane dehydrogenase subunit SoxC